jgi:hypothetical protein
MLAVVPSCPSNFCSSSPPPRPPAQRGPLSGVPLRAGYSLGGRLVTLSCHSTINLLRCMAGLSLNGAVACGTQPVEGSPSGEASSWLCSTARWRCSRSRRARSNGRSCRRSASWVGDAFNLDLLGRRFLSGSANSTLSRSSIAERRDAVSATPRSRPNSSG